MATVVKKRLERSDLAVNWQAINPVLKRGEIGHAYDTNVVKFGNGFSHWNDLPGITGSGAGGGNIDGGDASSVFGGGGIDGGGA